MISKPESAEYDQFYSGYVSLVIDENIEIFLHEQMKAMLDFFSKLSAEKTKYAYAEGKWTIKQVLRHLIDAERVFAYRIMALARRDKTPLPGFDEGDYITNADDDSNQFSDLVDEFALLRQANVAMIKNFNLSTWIFVGTVSGSPTSTRAMIFILAGHAAHHMKVLKERYF